MARRSSVNSSLVVDLNEEAIEKHKDFRKIGAPKYGRLRLHRISRILGDPLIEEGLKNAQAKAKSDFGEKQNEQPEDKTIAMKNQLSEIETVAIATVLESIVDMLNILRFTNDKPDVEPTITYLTLDERFGELQRDELILDTDKPQQRNLNSKHELYSKMQGERGSLEVTLAKTIHDLVIKGNYALLEDYVIYKMFVTYEEDQLELQVKLNEESITDYKEKIVKQKYFMERLGEELDRKVAQTKDKLYEMSLVSDIRRRYATKWEKARGQQHHYALVHHERDLKKRVENAKSGVDHEIHANHQILSFLTLDIEQLTVDVKTWAEKSFEDLEEIDLQTQKKKTVYNYVAKEVEEAQEVFQERQRQIMEHEQEKQRRQHEEQMRILRNAMARRIQGWWRAILMRRRLKVLQRKGKPGKPSGKK